MLIPTSSYFVGFFLILISWFTGGVLFTDIFALLLPDELSGHPLALFIELHLSFIALALGLVIAWRFIVGRRPVELITENRPVNLRRSAAVLAIWLVLLVLAAAAEHIISPAAVTPQPDWRLWLLFLPAVLLLTPLQSTVEELVFRSYIARWLSSAGLGMLTISLVSGALFLLLHLLNPEISLYGDDLYLYIYYFLFGFLMMLLGLLDRSFELPIAIHTANNLFAVLILTYPGSALPAPALFRAEGANPLAATLTLAFGTLLVYLLFVRKSRRAD